LRILCCYCAINFIVDRILCFYCVINFIVDIVCHDTKDDEEIGLINDVIMFTKQLIDLKLSDIELALLCAVVLINPSKCDSFIR